jgi:hypothetical protein
MKQMGCEHENRVLRAMRSGKWTAELRQHAAGCADCSEAMRVAEALQAEARHSEMQCHPPDAHWILERSRRLAREAAVRRMSRLLKAMRILAAIYAMAAGVWLTRGYAALPYREIASSFHGPSSHFMLLGAIVTAAFASAGLWPILREDGKRHGFDSGR